MASDIKLWVPLMEGKPDYNSFSTNQNTHLLITKNTNRLKCLSYKIHIKILSLCFIQFYNTG